jgi:hypothetical protein
MLFRRDLCFKLHCTVGEADKLTESTEDQFVYHLTGFKSYLTKNGMRIWLHTQNSKGC